MAGVLQHLRSSTLDKRPNPASMVDGQLAINYASGSPGAFFKDSNGNLVKVGPVHVGSGAPNASPASGGTAGNSIGEQWLDTSGGTYVFKIWDGAAWRSEAGEFVNSTGDTMTGALVMDNQQQVRFRETTANGTNYVALQAPASVASDKTITLPDVTGTVITTGDTGTVTGTIIASSTITSSNIASGTITSSNIADGTIVDADISASAEIAVSKLADGSARQLLQTDAAGTGVEWTSNVDIPGALDVTGAAVFDSTVNVTGAATVTGNLTVDTNTLFVDAANNRVGIGTTPESIFHVKVATNENIRFTGGSGDTRIACLNDATSATTQLSIQGSPLLFRGAGGTEVGRWDTSGRLLVGTVSSPAYQLQLATDSAGKPSTNTWTIVSDERIKEEIELADLDLCYEAVKNIPLKRFKWKDEVYTEEQAYDRRKLGWIAQDVEAVFPKAVRQHEFKYNQVFEEVVIPAVPAELDDDGNIITEEQPERIEKGELISEEVIEDCRDLNSDQLYAAMYGAIQKLISKVELLEAEVQALKAA